MNANKNNTSDPQSDHHHHHDGGGSGRELLVPIASVTTNNSSLASTILQRIQFVFFTLPMCFVGIVLVLVLIGSGFGPLYEWYQYYVYDKKELNRDYLLQQHPECFVLEIPPGINAASYGKPYKVMVRMTKPQSPNLQQQELPPIILPGGLASNLMTLSKHQDMLTSTYGFTVVNFDRFGVGLSDPIPTNKEQQQQRPPSALDVAREMNYVMTHCWNPTPTANTTYGSLQQHQDTTTAPPPKWIIIGSSMGANVATSFFTLFPNRTCGFLNLDGLPHAFIKIQCQKFLQEGPYLMNSVLKKMRWTGLPRLAFTMVLQPILPVMGANEQHLFTSKQIIGAMCSEQFFTTTALEYKTLMSCCDLEIAAWGKQATTNYYPTGEGTTSNNNNNNDKTSIETMFLMSTLEPYQSVLVNENEKQNKKMNPEPPPPKRQITNMRSTSELGTHFIHRNDPRFQNFETNTFHKWALQNSKDINRVDTNCNWPKENPQHPVGNFIGGIEEDTPLYPLYQEFRDHITSVRVMCARNYSAGTLEKDYTQEARNHSAARTSLHTLCNKNGKSYYYPQLTHLNLWQQRTEIITLAYEMANQIRSSRRNADAPTVTNVAVSI